MTFLKFDTPYPAISFNTLFPRAFRNKSKTKQNDFFDLFPASIYTMEDGTHFAQSRPGRISKYWSAYDPDSQADYQRVMDNILTIAASGNHTYSSLPEIAVLNENVAVFIEKLPDPVREEYKLDISALITRFLSGIEQGEKQYLAFQDKQLDVIFSQRLNTFSEKLAFLMLIAATWLFWSRAGTEKPYPEDAEAVRCLSMIMMPSPENTITAAPAELTQSTQSEIAVEKDIAAGELKLAEKSFEEHNYDDCGSRCKRIISMGFVEPKVRGDAYYLLVKCHEDHNYSYVGYYNAPRFMRRAISLGSERAKSEWKTLHQESLVFNASAASSPIAKLVLNVPASNKYASFVLHSLPPEMAAMSQAESQKSIIHICSGNPAEDILSLQKTVCPGEPIKFLFLDEDLDKNFHDLLHVLNAIKTQKSVRARIDSWKGIELYLRTDEESFSPLIDTALKHMDGVIVPVHLIDDAKWAVQQLLARHPVFYPIRSVPKRKLETTAHELNINILSVPDELCTRLVREAFWITCFAYKNLTINVNVFSPGASDVESTLRFRCKGLWAPLPDAEHTSKINLRFLPDCDLSSSQLIANLNKYCFNDSSFDYFIINAGSDIASMSLGIKVRELSIEKAVHAGLRLDKIDLPIIAYKCEDPDYAHLVESMVVQMEEHGDSFYNNYALIPFGTLSEHYCYDTLSGGHMEQQSQATHLQYSGIAPDCSMAEKEKALESYFTRCYNRDSSMAGALSIPYRLFQTSTYSGQDHIIPTGWNITNSHAYTKDLSAAEIAAAFSQRNNDNELLMQEHSRWLRWCISRGWSPATPEETIRYMDAGNPKQQLYISRLHPCICSLEELGRLSQAMFEHYCETGDMRFVEKNGQKKDFVSFDTAILSKTTEILIDTSLRD